MEVNNWTQTTDGEQLFEFEHDVYGAILRGEDREFADQKVTRSWAVTVQYRSKTLLTLFKGKSHRKQAMQRAVSWMEAHSGFAGLRVNDGVENEQGGACPDTALRQYTEWREGERASAVEDLEEWGFGVGDVYFDEESNTYFEVTELTTDGFVVRPYHEGVEEAFGIYSTYLANIAVRAEDGVVTPVPEHVVRNPTQILERFAEIEVSKYLQTLGPTHDFNGINGVDTVGDLRAALHLGRSALRE